MKRILIVEDDELIAELERDYLEANGYEATIAIRSLDSPVSRIPIIAMSANAFAEDVQEAKDAGMNAHSAKPIEIEHLLATLRDLIGQ